MDSLDFTLFGTGPKTSASDIEKRKAEKMAKRENALLNQPNANRVAAGLAAPPPRTSEKDFHGLFGEDEDGYVKDDDELDAELAALTAEMKAEEARAKAKAKAAKAKAAEEAKLKAAENAKSKAAKEAEEKSAAAAKDEEAAAAASTTTTNIAAAQENTPAGTNNPEINIMDDESMVGICRSVGQASGPCSIEDMDGSEGLNFGGIQITDANAKIVLRRFPDGRFDIVILGMIAPADTTPPSAFATEEKGKSSFPTPDDSGFVDDSSPSRSPSPAPPTSLKRKHGGDEEDTGSAAKRSKTEKAPARPKAQSKKPVKKTIARAKMVPPLPEKRKVAPKPEQEQTALVATDNVKENNLTIAALRAQVADLEKQHADLACDKDDEQASSDGNESSSDDNTSAKEMRAWQLGVRNRAGKKPAAAPPASKGRNKKRAREEDEDEDDGEAHAPIKKRARPIKKPPTKARRTR